MKTFVSKLVFIFGIVLLITGAMFYFTKHNIITRNSAKLYVASFNQHDLVVKNEMCEERMAVLENIVLHQNQHFTYIMLGSSRIMQLGKNTGFNNTLNLGVSGAGFEDIQFIFNQILQNKISYDTIILDCNPWWLLDVDNRYKQFYWNDNKKELLSDLLFFNYNFADLVTLIGYSNNFKYNLQNAQLSDIQNQQSFIKFTDGSIQQKRLDNPTRKKIIDDFVHDFNKMSGFYQINMNRFKKLDSFFNVLGKKGICIAALFPFHPSFYLKNQQDKRVKNIDLFEKMLYENHSGYRVIGSYRPEKMNILESDFYDHLHLNAHALYKVFNANLALKP